MINASDKVYLAYHPYLTRFPWYAGDRIERVAKLNFVPLGF